MSRRLRFTAAAANDLADIRGYIRERNPSAANRLMKRFRRTFNLLLKNPGMGALVGSDPPGIRSVSVGVYVIHFRQAKLHVEIVRVVHGARESPILE